MKPVATTLAGSAVAVVVFALTACVPPVQNEAPAPEQSVPETEQESPAPEQETEPPVTEPAEPEVETTDTDGVFSYEITDSGERGVFYDTYGDAYYPDEDKFFIVEVTATNESSAPATAPDPWMYEHVVAIDSEGRSHQADDEPWTDDLTVNPGGSVTYFVPWDLPLGVWIEYVEFAAYDAPGVAVIEVQ